MTEPGWGSLTSEDVERLRVVLLKAVRRYCPAWMADSREDLVQAALTRVLDIWSRHEEREPPQDSYLLKVAYTAMLKEIRRMRSHPEGSLETPGVGESLPAPAGDPGREAESRELGEAIRDCLDQLREPRRSAVVLYLHGFSLEQSAQTLRTSAKVVDNQRYRGLRALRSCLQRKGFTP